MAEKLIIFDTTLRDGEQSPGASMTKEEKMRIARQLEKLGVDVIEAGFAAASPGDAGAIQAIARIIEHSTVCSLARANERDVRAAGEAIKPAKSGRIHTFIATSPIHMEKKLRMTPDQVVENAVKAVKLALEYTDDVEFSAEDAVRSEMDFLVRVFDAVIQAGAKTLNVPDTVGYSIPALWGERIRQLMRIDTTQIVPTSKLVSSITGYPVQPNKAIVGANAFAHESGIHQDGVIKHRETYEIMRAEDVGWSTNKLTLGKLSGRNAFRSRLHELGIVLESEEALNTAFAHFKDLADRKSEIFDEDLQALVNEETVAHVSEHYRLVSMRAHSETGEAPSARVVLSVDGKERIAEAKGGGPVDATLKAIDQVAQSGTELLLYSVNNITSGTDAQGEVTVRLSRGGRVVNGQGADTDIVVASAKAYLNALNKLHAGAERAHPQV
ncbi:MAG: 2-isopropylmalate synthase [Gallionellaceae bacterium]|nr:MAG: 2-isopropylmalate synthase [Gallionellaceae bacterium]